MKEQFLNDGSGSYEPGPEGGYSDEDRGYFLPLFHLQCIVIDTFILCFVCILGD